MMPRTKGAKNKQPAKPTGRPGPGRTPNPDKVPLVGVSVRVEPRYRDYLAVLAEEKPVAQWIREWIDAERKQRGD